MNPFFNRRPTPRRYGTVARALLTLGIAAAIFGTAPALAASQYHDPAWQLASIDAGGPVKASQVAKYQRPLKRVATLCHVSRSTAADFAVTGWKLLNKRFSTYFVLKQYSKIDHATVKGLGCRQAFAAETTLLRESS